MTSCLAGKNGVRVSGTVAVLFIASGLLSLLSWKEFLLWLWEKSIHVGMLSELYESDDKVMHWPYHYPPLILHGNNKESNIEIWA
jgi:hypothetical protein